MTGTRTGRRTALALLPILAVLGVVGIAATQDTSDVQPIVHTEPVVESNDAAVLGLIDALGVIDSAERYATAYWQQVAEYATNVNIGTWVAAHQPPPVTRTRSSATIVSSGGHSAGPHSDAWWHGVAQCEQGGRNDPHFGYFSFMDGSQGGRPWDEQVAAGNALLQRAGREVGPWAASCVASGYRASPGG